MSTRNFILLIAVLAIIFAGILGYWYIAAQKPPSMPEETPSFLSKFNPFKPSPLPAPAPSPSPNPSEDGGMTPGTTVDENLKLIKISDRPVAGYGIFDKERLVALVETEVLDPAAPINKKPLPPKTELATALRYVDRATGNIFETFADKIDERQFSNTSIPQVYEAYFGNKGSMVVMRYLKSDDRTIETFVGTLPKEVLGEDSSQAHEVKGTFLPENISSLSMSIDGSKAFYILPSSDGVMGITLELATSKKVQIFQNAFTEWLTSWGVGKVISLTTKPSAQVPGYMYVLDPVTKSFTRVLGGTVGLTALVGPDSKTVLYSDSSLTLHVFNMSTGASANTGLHTLPEKCVWGAIEIYCAVPKNVPPGDYPDSWYQGAISFNDQIWSINIGQGTTSLLLDPATVPGGEAVDATKLSVDPKGDFLFFVNKIDSRLWEYKLR